LLKIQTHRLWNIHGQNNKRMSEDYKDKDKAGTGPGLAVVGCLATGVLACIGGLTGIVNQQLPGAALCFIAAAFAFGIVAYVSFSR
jgi:hypothetical protein